jgi:hypothetical protein
LEYESRLSANRHFEMDKCDYEKVLQSTALVLSMDPSDIEAADLKNSALYQFAAGLQQQRRYLEALEH